MAPEDEFVAPPTSFHVPRWSRPFSVLARYVKGWNFLLVLVLIPLTIGAISVPPAFIYEMCEGDGFNRTDRITRCLESNAVLLGLGELLAAAFVLLLFAVLGAGFGWIGHRRRSKQLRRSYEKRAQGIRDHVITGQTSPEAFDEVQRLWKPLVRAEHPTVRARAGTSTAIIFNILTSLAFGIGLTIYTITYLVMSIEAEEDTAEFVVVWNSIFIPILGLLLVTMLWGWVQFPRAHAQAVHATNEAIDAAERSEVRVFASPTAGRRTRTAVAADGPSFAPYTGRSRSE